MRVRENGFSFRTTQKRVYARARDSSGSWKQLAHVIRERARAYTHVNDQLVFVYAGETITLDLSSLLYPLYHHREE